MNPDPKIEAAKLLQGAGAWILLSLIPILHLTVALPLMLLEAGDGWAMAAAGVSALYTMILGFALWWAPEAVRSVATWPLGLTTIVNFGGMFAAIGGLRLCVAASLAGLVASFRGIMVTVMGKQTVTVGDGRYVGILGIVQSVPFVLLWALSAWADRGWFVAVAAVVTGSLMALPGLPLGFVRFRGLPLVGYGILALCLGVSFGWTLIAIVHPVSSAPLLVAVTTTVGLTVSVVLGHWLKVLVLRLSRRSR